MQIDSSELQRLGVRVAPNGDPIITQHQAEQLAEMAQQALSANSTTMQQLNGPVFTNGDESSNDSQPPVIEPILNNIAQDPPGQFYSKAFVSVTFHDVL